MLDNNQISHRQGHVFECTHYGFDAQFEKQKRILSTTDLPIYAIAGNHQAWAMNAVGADINRYLGRDLRNTFIIQGMTMPQ